MSTDPYKILGVERTADEKTLKSAYRKLAKQYHPDLNPGSKESADKFKSISVAYELLSNAEKRAAFDRGELDSEGNQKQQQKYYSDFADSQGGQRYHQYSPGNFGGAGMEDILKNIFSGGFGGFGGNGSGGFPGSDKVDKDMQYSIEIDFMEAALGAKKTINMPDGKQLNINIPEGINDGQKLRLKGQGQKGGKNATGQASPGDAYVEIHVRPHKFFTRDNNNINIEVLVSLDETILGKKIKVPTIHGAVEVAIPKGAGNSTKLRLKGKGIKGGDQYVKLRLELPENIDSELEESIRKWAATHSYNPRKNMEAL